jgi:predicted amidohydrolase YtcJ
MKIFIPILAFITLIHPVPGEVSADIIFVHGKIYTVAHRGDRAEALAVKDGIIVAVGKETDVNKYRSEKTQIVDLHGKTVVPGFNDAHLHPLPVYPFESLHNQIPLGPSDVKNIDELVTILKKKADITPPGFPIRGYAYEDTKLGGHPTRQILDRVSLKHPVIIRHSSGHISAVNSFVLNLAGITKATPDPAGGSFDRDANGEPNGVCRENALSDFFRSGKMKVPDPPTEHEEMEAYKKCFDAYISHGITSITEAGSSFSKMAIYEKLEAQGYPLRINLLMSESILDDVVKRGIKQGYGNEHLRISGIKAFHGNSLSGRTCWLNDPYDMINPATGKKDYYGIPPKRSQQQLDSLFLKIHQNGLQIACHSNGDREIEMVILAMERAQQKAPSYNRRHRIEHCSVTNDSILYKIRRDSIMVVLHSYIYEHGDKMVVYGASRWGMMHPDRSVIDMGIASAQHSDSPISVAIPLVRIQSLVTRTSKEGIVIGPNQKISAEEAIRLWTYGGAYASFEEKIKGTLEVGKVSDFVVLSDDPSTVDPFTIKDIQVEATVISGKVAFESAANTKANKNKSFK